MPPAMPGCWKPKRRSSASNNSGSYCETGHCVSAQCWPCLSSSVVICEAHQQLSAAPAGMMRQLMAKTTTESKRKQHARGKLSTKKKKHLNPSCLRHMILICRSMTRVFRNYISAPRKIRGYLSSSSIF